MKVVRNVFTIGDIYRWFSDKELVVNHNYQRGGGLWPKNARAYFIDTILKEYPFPKIIMRQTIDVRTRKTIREIIDGQQRLTAIIDFINDKITLTNVTSYDAKKYSELDEDLQEVFLGYEISVDTVITNNIEEVLEIFRRMNSYTLPLNEAEKRHATYQGKFKWYIKQLLDKYIPFFEAKKVLSLKQISRMDDADLFTEIVQIIDFGIDGRSTKKLNDLYKKYDSEQSDLSYVNKIFVEVMDFIIEELDQIFESELMNGFQFYSLFAGLVFNKYGIKNIKDENIKSIDSFGNNYENAIQTILEMLRDVEEKNIDGKYSEFVKASLETTHSIKNRKTRTMNIALALQNKI